jgi:diguanylate cyclase (GGDEF)-like protein/PAS domain S-box-containing protein
MRLSVGLVLFTINLLFLAHQIGLIPDASESALALRKTLSESLALQFSKAAGKGEYQAIQETLRAVVARNESIRSAAIRTRHGELIALVGEHLAHWEQSPDDKSTPTHISVPLFDKDKKWATVEIRFGPLWGQSQVFGFAVSFAGLLVFVGFCSFGFTFLMLKRTLRELDPTAVIPGRVRRAFDVLQEGVLILDDKEQIVMANTSFAALLDKAPEALVGLKGSELGWLECRTRKQIEQLPWRKLAGEGVELQSASLSLPNGAGGRTKLAVNAVAVTDGSGKRRGCLATFDDITQLEEKNFELKELVEKLRLSNEEINTKSKELEFLANRDPLTLCLNRRALDRHLDTLFSMARNDGSPLACMMVDIDHFKSVNDRYGHATGDLVIKAVADELKTSTRDSDLVGRYGGEEFCVVLSGVDAAKAREIAERMRTKIQAKDCSGVKITASLGVAALKENCMQPEELVNQADKALYVAKESGRNRVVVWGEQQPVAPGVDGAAAVSEKPSSPEAKAAGPSTGDAKLGARVKELEGLLKRKTIELQHVEMYDIHTGLPTRGLFEDRAAHEIARCRRTEGLVVLLAIVVDTIKRVDETLGHNAAQRLVKACGLRLNDILREDIDMVSVIEDRDTATSISLINETEFGILLPDIKQVDHVTWVMTRLLEALEKPFKIKGQDIYVTPYMGVGIFPYDGQSVEELYSSAVNACHYAAEQKGDHRYAFASPRINKSARKQLQIKSALHDAIANGELALHYQPQVHVASGRISRFEALLRWQNTDLGFVPPNEFIPVAEQSGLINPIGDWVLEEAMRQQREWLDAGFDVSAMAVNLSGVQLRQPGILGRIKALLGRYELQNHQLEIELTESTLVDSHDRSLEVLRKIKRSGIQVAMDDFGTGYSSLAYLKEIPLSCLKIDRSFIMGIGEDRNSEKLVASIISMAHELDLEVVAEGIETQHQADFLTALGCEYLQGYHIGRPAPAEDAANYLRAGREVSSAA